MIRETQIIIVFMLCVALCSCGKKIVKSGIPFGFDEVFRRGTIVVPEENSREKGVRLAKDRQYQEAITAFKESVEESPENFFGFNAIAVCYKNLGDHANAMKNFERALEFSDSPEEKAKVLANIGNLYFAANKPQAALGFYKEAAGAFEKNPLYLIFIARTFVVLGDYDRARKVLTTVEENFKDLDKFEKDDERGLGAYLTAYCYAGLNEEDKVYKYLEMALQANPQRYYGRLQKEISDEKSLFYSLQDDPKFMKMMERFK